ncbi:winged helix-turn-helix transcriptional regulator, partial [Klebsiella pneumoniae]|uniref:winged helix-turn-helix transcriptional regulator n=1 Tax=Klebsiella pneumoniae TaxID=573 RepID=UPI0035BF4C59
MMPYSVRDALRGVRRFSEFQKNLGIAKNMLAGRLKMLVDEGILRLQPASDGSDVWRGGREQRTGDE